MKTTLTRHYPFSASFERGGRVIGHNYRLSVTVDCVDEAREALLDKRIHDTLISKVSSRDLTLHVDFLKDIPITDQSLLRTFWDLLEKELSDHKLHRLVLRRNDLVETTLSHTGF